jgi:Uma2 family endonuclease
MGRSLATWQEYQRWCEQRGDGVIPRLKYRHGEVLLRSPLPVHGRNTNLIADIAKALLDQEVETFTFSDSFSSS